MASPKTYSGSDGRISAVLVAPDLTLPTPTITGTTADIAGITKWQQRWKSNNGEPLVHFEGVAHASGAIYEEHIQGGVIGWEVDVEGYLDLTASTGTVPVFVENCFIYCDFILTKNGIFGFAGAGGKVNGLTFGPAVKGGPQTFQFKLLGHKAWPALSAVS